MNEGTRRQLAQRIAEIGSDAYDEGAIDIAVICGTVANAIRARHENVVANACGNIAIRLKLDTPALKTSATTTEVETIQ